MLVTSGHFAVTARLPDPTAFAPFGAFLEPPGDVGARALFSSWMEPVPGRSPRYHLNRVAPSALPATLDRVERHPHAAQLFLPIGVSRYLVTVMPSDVAGRPDASRAQAYVVPGTVGVAYHPGTWHAGIAVLDREASFAVLMWRGGDDDDEFASIPALEIAVEPGSGARALDHGGDRDG
ncbi:MAG: ureidoglycolate lyase [Gemmatimonadetes bacterium]|nr:ureidoglycolate lyase [Gemmatimonadota bacterium]